MSEPKAALRRHEESAAAVRAGQPAATPTIRSPFVWAVGLLALSFGIRAVYVLHTWHYIPGSDAHAYNTLGSGLADGRGWVDGSSAYRPPGYPFFLAAVYTIIGTPHHFLNAAIAHYGGWTELRLVEAGLATVSVGLTGWLARQVIDARTALISMAIAAVYLPYVLVGESILSESLLVPLELATVNFAVRARSSDRRYLWPVLAGLFAGLCALTRGNGIVIGLALAFVLGTETPRFSRAGLRSPAIAMIVMALTIVPWTIRNAIAQHAFIPVTTELGATLSGTYNSVAARHDYIYEAGYKYPDYGDIRHNRRLPELQRDSRLTSDVVAYIGRHPQAVPLAMAWNTVRLLDLAGSHLYRSTADRDVGATAAFADLSVYSFWIVAILAVIGTFAPAARRVAKGLWLVPLFIWLSEAPITTGTPRFRAALDPWFILLGSCAVAWIAQRLRTARVKAGSRANRPRRLSSDPGGAA